MFNSDTSLISRSTDEAELLHPTASFKAGICLLLAYPGNENGLKGLNTLIGEVCSYRHAWGDGVGVREVDWHAVVTELSSVADLIGDAWKMCWL